MNCATLFVDQTKICGSKTAIWMPTGESVTFAQLREMATRAQGQAWAYGLKPGSTVLLMVPLHPVLYGVVLGLVSSGISVVLVEPWLSVGRIEKIIRFVQPDAFVTSLIGRAWGARVPAVREIRRWVSVRDMLTGRSSPILHLEQVKPDAPALITFTSGTVGSPKGMVRGHQYLVDQHRILTEALNGDELKGPDLTIFANFVLANLASGRTSVLVPSSWKVSHLRLIEGLTQDLAPVSVTCGPAFLQHLMQQGHVTSLQSFHVGGALTDCETFERGFEKWPDADWTHLYGSTEAEPVALCDARVAVQKSRKAGFFQTLYLGQPIADINFKIETDTVWVNGPHVCPEYLANEEENLRNKRRDIRGNMWHRMGDRICVKEDGWWYHGRSQQAAEVFEMEQKLYASLGASTAFLDQKADGLHVYTEAAELRKTQIQVALGQNVQIHETRIRRDPRHRARIDRRASLRSPGLVFKIKNLARKLQGFDMMQLWRKPVFPAVRVFLKERFPLPVYFLLAGGLTASGAAYWEDSFQFLSILLCFLGVMSFFGLLRLMDELKDYETDVIAHPERPLPRGDLTVSGVKRAISWWTLMQLVLALLIAITMSPVAGAAYVAVTAYLWLMYREFYAKKWLEEHMLIYAGSHQFVLILLCAFTVSVGNSSAFRLSETYFYGLTVLGSFFTYEVCRKLDPHAHKLLRTYRSLYGLKGAGALVLASSFLAMYAGWMAGVAVISWPFALSVPIVFFFAAQQRHRLVEIFASISLIVHLWAAAVPV